MGKLLTFSKWRQKMKPPQTDSDPLTAVLGRIATALEVMAGLRQRTEPGKDESEVMESVDAVYAQQEADELMKGRPEEED